MILSPSYSPIINSLLLIYDVLVQTIVVDIIKTKTILRLGWMIRCEPKDFRQADHIDLKNVPPLGRTRYVAVDNVQGILSLQP